MGRAGYGSKLPVRAARGFTVLLSIAMAAATLVSKGDRAAAQDLPAQPSSPAAVEPTPAAAEPRNTGKSGGTDTGTAPEADSSR